MKKASVDPGVIPDQRRPLVLWTSRVVVFWKQSLPFRVLCLHLTQLARFRVEFNEAISYPELKSVQNSWYDEHDNKELHC